MLDHGHDTGRMLEDGLVTVNGRAENRRGRQLADGDVVAVDGQQARLVARS